MRYWLALAFVPELDQFLTLAKLAEELGFYGVTVADHLVVPTKITTPYPHSASGEVGWSPANPWPDPWVALAAMGAVTRTLRLATNIYLAALRDPFSAAKAVATTAAMVGDRVVVGVGAGWMKDEFDLLGVDFARRGERLDELLPLLRRLWTGEPVAHEGKHFRFPEVVVRPRPGAPVPILTGGTSPAALRRAAQLGDGWMAMVHTREQVLPMLGQLTELRAAAGRSEQPFEVLMGLGERHAPDTLAELEAAGVSGLIVNPWMRGPGEDTSSLDVKRRALEQFAEKVVRRAGR